MILSRQIELPSLEATQRFAAELAVRLEAPMTVALNGTLGAGKTQLVRFLADYWGIPAEEVTSPTYVLLQRYRGRHCMVYHLDFYRLGTAAQVWDLGIDELYEQAVLVLIEWADKFPECLPEDYLRLELIPTGEISRVVQLSSSGQRSADILRRLIA